MTNRRTNNLPGRCALCGAEVAAGEGEIERREAGGWRLEHREGDCRGLELDGDGRNGGERPTWAVYVAGGARIVSGRRPEGGEPLNAAARAMHRAAEDLRPPRSREDVAAEHLAWLRERFS